jgi:hypothetical protein
MHAKVVGILEKRKAAKVDPLKVLPFELVDMIFKHLPFESLMYAISTRFAPSSSAVTAHVNNSPIGF